MMNRLSKFFASALRMDWADRVEGLLALAAVVIAICLLTGCQTLPQPPKVVTKVVTEYRELPGWATEQVANAPPVDQSVRAIAESNSRRGETLDYVNCRSRLLERLGKGEPVDALACVK